MMYILKARLTSVHNGTSVTDYFEFDYGVDFLTETGQNSSFYDSKLKMHLEDKSALGTIYQIDIHNIYLELQPRLKKAAEFIRRIQYIYDWIEVNVNNIGVVKSIANREELKATWKGLRSKLLYDYKGKAVERYLNEKEAVLNSSDGILPCVYTYLNFGMIFPHIPPKHGDDWGNSRQVFFSEYENETVEEMISYVGLHEDKRRYNVSWSTSEGQVIKMVSGEGYYLVDQNSIFPESARLQIEYSNGSITNNWNFQLEKY